jgi:hypothetical protein
MKWLRDKLNVPPAVPFWTAVVAQFIFAAAAQAGCGDYVIIGQSLTHPAAITLSNARFVKAAHTQPLPIRDQPCYGAGCRNGAPIPSTPVGLTTNGTPQWLCLDAPVIAGPADAWNRIENLSGVVLPDRNERPPEPPPRAS